MILENDETITNSTDGTILIDGKADFNDNAITGYGADLQTESGTSISRTDNGTIIVCPAIVRLPLLYRLAYLQVLIA